MFNTIYNCLLIHKMNKYKNNGLCGLMNLGNTCFINACIQIFSHTYEMHSIMDKIDMDKMVAAMDKDKSDFAKTKGINKSGNNKSNNSNNQKKYSVLILVEWNHLRKSLWSKNDIVRPVPFVKTIQFVAKKKGLQEFTSFRQTDIQEFMLFFVDCLHTSLSRKIKIDISGQPVTKTDTLATKCFEMIKQRYENDYSEFWNLFYGIQVSEICDAKTNEIFSQTPEPYFIIDLPLTVTTSSNTLKTLNTSSNTLKTLNTSSKNPLLTDCLNLYVKGEFIEGYHHEERKQTFHIHKKLSFWSFPTILVICLKRFKENNVKIKTRIDFPFDLDLTSYAVGYKSASFVYTLYGVCNHFGGSPSSGHYTSYIKNANDTWYEFDDCTVTEITANHVVTPHAYMLFYRKNAPIV